MLTYVRAISLLALVYLALTSNLQPSNIVVGVLLATAVVLILRPTPEPLNVRNLPRALWALLRYLVILVYDLIASGIQVARIVLDPRLPLRQGIVAIKPGVASDVAVALSAHAITVTPGEMVVEIDDEGVMYTHSLDATHAAEIGEAAQRMRDKLLSRIFE